MIKDREKKWNKCLFLDKINKWFVNIAIKNPINLSWNNKILQPSMLEKTAKVIT